MKDLTPEQQQIQELELKVENLKTTTKNLDESFFSGAIEEEEYYKMKKSLADRIKSIMDEIKQIKSSQ